MRSACPHSKIEKQIIPSRQVNPDGRDLLGWEDVKPGDLALFAELNMNVGERNRPGIPDYDLNRL